MCYSRTETKEGNDCIIIRDAHISEIIGKPGGPYYVATVSTIYYGWMGTECSSESKIFTAKNCAEAYCDNFLD